jgi:hypothetical protein
MITETYYILLIKMLLFYTINLIYNMWNYSYARTDINTGIDLRQGLARTRGKKRPISHRSWL